MSSKPIQRIVGIPDKAPAHRLLISSRETIAHRLLTVGSTEPGSPLLLAQFDRTAEDLTLLISQGLPGQIKTATFRLRQEPLSDLLLWLGRCVNGPGFAAREQNHE